MASRGRSRNGRKGTPFRSSETEFALREGGGLRLAVIADTHSHPHPQCHALIEALHPDAILHAGDIGDVSVLSALEKIAPLVVVRGNIDERAADLPDGITIDVRQGDASAIKLYLTHIAVAGPRLRADAARRAHAAGASLVICGHSHVPFLGKDRGLTVFNAGSCGPRRFHLPIVFGVLEIAEGRLSLRHIDCETGQDWSPQSMHQGTTMRR